jgi:hypothetical protein
MALALCRIIIIQYYQVTTAAKGRNTDLEPGTHNRHAAAIAPPAALAF